MENNQASEVQISKRESFDWAVKNLAVKIDTKIEDGSLTNDDITFFMSRMPKELIPYCFQRGNGKMDLMSIFSQMHQLPQSLLYVEGLSAANRILAVSYVEKRQEEQINNTKTYEAARNIADTVPSVDKVYSYIKMIK